MRIQQRNRKYKEFLEALKLKDGCVRDACHEIGISTQTYYNWKDKSDKFREDAEKIFAEKKKEMDTFVEGKLFGQIKNNSIPAILFYLRMRHPEYNSPKQTIEVAGKFEGKLNYQDKKLVEEAIKFGYGVEIEKIKQENKGVPRLPEVAGK